jgi:hypothetical protein
MSSCCTPAQNGLSGVTEGAGCAVHDEETVGPNSLRIQHCPVCGQKGKGVDTLTVKAMLAVSLHAIHPVGYGFCRTEDCLVIYFSLDGEQTMGETDLRELIHQKHPNDDDVYVCYCFRHTPGSIRAELSKTGQSTVVETVTRGTQTDQCACEIRNPQGSCCLGNVRAAVKRATGELESQPVTE